MHRAALLFLALLPAASARVVVNSSTPIFIDAREPAPLQKAASDLASDCLKVFGQRARIVHTPPAAGTPVIWIALDAAAPRPVQKPTGWESLRIQAIPNEVVLTGSDL